MKCDIVYILQNGYNSEEIIYSIRSVCANFPYRKIWIYGGRPAGIEPDRMVEYVQTGANKWERVNNTIRAICGNNEITEDFWLFNDDFFVMKKVRKLEPMVGGTIWARAQKLSDRLGGRESHYARQIKDTARILRDKGYDRLDYALHVPMLINRRRALLTLDEFTGCPMFRSLYGNHHNICGVITKDVKISGLVDAPTGAEVFLSTDDVAFKDGPAGEYIRNAFPTPCKYE